MKVLIGFMLGVLFTIALIAWSRPQTCDHVGLWAKLPDYFRCVMENKR